MDRLRNPISIQRSWWKKSLSAFRRFVDFTCGALLEIITCRICKVTSAEWADFVSFRPMKLDNRRTRHLLDVRRVTWAATMTSDLLLFRLLCLFSDVKRKGLVFGCNGQVNYWEIRGSNFRRVVIVSLTLYAVCVFLPNSDTAGRQTTVLFQVLTIAFPALWTV